MNAQQPNTLSQSLQLAQNSGDGSFPATRSDAGDVAVEPRRAFSPFYLELCDAASELGVDDFGFAPVADAATFDVFADAVRRGATAGLSYLEENVEARRSPRSVLPNAQTIIVVVLSQRRLRAASVAATNALFESLNAASSSVSSERSALPTDSIFPASFNGPQNGAVLEYAVSLDYHDVLRRALRRLQTLFRAHFPEASSRAAVDTAPILEKDWAVRTGLGFCGLHSLLIHRRFGSRLFLGELLVSTSFEKLTGFSTPEAFRAVVGNRETSETSLKQRLQASSTPRFEAKNCLSCRRCVDACPTGALVGDRTLDARRCLNFWTIENREEIPPEIARKLDGRLFGCDRCQRVCPWNARNDSEPTSLELTALDALDDATFRKIFRKTPIFRAKLDGLQRVATALRENVANKLEK